MRVVLHKKKEILPGTQKGWMRGEGTTVTALLATSNHTPPPMHEINSVHVHICKTCGESSSTRADLVRNDGGLGEAHQLWIRKDVIQGTRLGDRMTDASSPVKASV